jgi:hypothetical protein
MLAIAGIATRHQIPIRDCCLTDLHHLLHGLRPSLSSRYQKMTFLGRRRRYPEASTCLGEPLGCINGKHWWHAVGKAKNDFAAIEADIRKVLSPNFERNYASTTVCHLYMIGRSLDDPESARPTVMFFCDREEPRKQAKAALEHAGILKSLPGFQAGHQQEQPEIGTLVQPAASASSSPSATPTSTRNQVYFDPTKPIRPVGMAVYAISEDGHVLQATANVVFEGQKLMLLSVSHTFDGLGPDLSEYSKSDQGAFDLGDWSDDEDESGDLMASISDVTTSSSEQRAPGSSTLARGNFTKAEITYLDNLSVRSEESSLTADQMSEPFASLHATAHDTRDTTFRGPEDINPTDFEEPSARARVVSPTVKLSHPSSVSSPLSASPTSQQSVVNHLLDDRDEDPEEASSATQEKVEKDGLSMDGTDVLLVGYHNTCSSTMRGSLEVTETLTAPEFKLEVLGHLVSSSVDQDWVTIEVTNQHVKSALDDFSTQGQVLAADIDANLDGKDNTPGSGVVVQTTHGLIPGAASSNSSHVRLPGSSTFVKLYQVALHAPLHWGDCGSLIFDVATGDVLGHVVAASAARDIAYILPATTLGNSTNLQWQRTVVTETRLRHTSAMTSELQEFDYADTSYRRLQQRLQHTPRTSWNDGSLMHSWHHGSPRDVYEDSADPIRNIREYINDNIVELQYRGETQRFLSQEHLSHVVTPSAIRAVFEKDDDLFLDPLGEADLVEFVMNKARKTFVCVVYSGLPPSCLKALIDDGLDDSRFPFSIEDCRRHKDNQLFRAAFVNNQKIFDAPFFHFGLHQVLDGGTPKPIEFLEDHRGHANLGAFGTVQKVRIHPGQYSFPKVSEPFDHR